MNKTFFIKTPLIFLLMGFLFFTACSGKQKFKTKEELGLSGADLTGTWKCDSARSNGIYSPKTITITGSLASITATQEASYYQKEKYFEGNFFENPFTIKRFISSESGALKFTSEFECELGVYSKDSIRVLIADDYSELYVRVKE